MPKPLAQAATEIEPIVHAADVRHAITRELEPTRIAWVLKWRSATHSETLSMPGNHLPLRRIEEPPLIMVDQHIDDLPLVEKEVNAVNLDVDR